MKNVQNVFEAILKYGHDEDFYPVASDEFEPTVRERVDRRAPVDVRAPAGDDSVESAGPFA